MDLSIGRLRLSAAPAAMNVVHNLNLAQNEHRSRDILNWVQPPNRLWFKNDDSH
jgi:hypothetical protein